eukprot:TRINITY_DN20087_c0_g1_i1.p1 TRINITY_DN20087_c0_g1~~TRINITY_DN20087_c0_g1_i1.p1  ORF type:complete len:369 (-),score=58.21 TRINITY_DN20087_c0_g1_i1:65-1114(-)
MAVSNNLLVYPVNCTNVRYHLTPGSSNNHKIDLPDENVGCVATCGSFIATANCTNYSISLWDVTQHENQLEKNSQLEKKSQLERRTILKGHHEMIESLEMTMDRVVSAAHDNTIRVWSIKEKTCIKLIYSVRSLSHAWIFNDVVMASCSRAIREYDVATGMWTASHAILPHSDPKVKKTRKTIGSHKYWRVVFNDTFITASTSDGIVVLYHRPTNTKVHQCYHKYVHLLALTSTTWVYHTGSKIIIRDICTGRALTALRAGDKIESLFVDSRETFLTLSTWSSAQLWKLQEISWNAPRKCLACGKDENSEKIMKICGHCRRARYCSVECQREHWTTHKSLCRQAVMLRP